jgi:hypothetical protein
MRLLRETTPHAASIVETGVDILTNADLLERGISGYSIYMTLC